MRWHICQHIDVSAYVSASEHVSILTSTGTNMLTCPDADIYADTFNQWWEICRHICQQIRSCAGKYADMSRWRHLFRNIKILTYIPALRCRHIILVVGNMLTYMSPHLFVCRQIFWHVQMPTYMPTNQDADIHANTLRCRHILLVVISMPT